MDPNLVRIAVAGAEVVTAVTKVPCDPGVVAPAREQQPPDEPPKDKQDSGKNKKV